MSTERTAPNLVQQQASRGFWLRTLHQWHWISSALCLIGMLLFSITGITLNHAAKIEATPQVSNRQLELPAPMREALGTREEGNAPLPAKVADWLSRELDVAIGKRNGEWSAEEIYISMPGPGSDAWLSIDRETGAVEYEATRRGWVACLVFCITGLFLLHLHARQRRMTWPLVGLGLLVPLLIALLLIH